MLQLAWRYGKEDPFCLYHGLGLDGRPVAEPGAGPRRQRPGRRASLLYGFGLAAFEDDALIGGAKLAARGG